MTHPRRGPWPVLTALSVAGLILSACGGGGEPAAQVTTEPGAVANVTTAPEEEAKVATFIWTQEFDTLNPAYTNQWFSIITHQLWNCWAWDFDDGNNPRPVLVTEIPGVEKGEIDLSVAGQVLKIHVDAAERRYYKEVLLPAHV